MRIRTIKPEFWASESVGRLSREARLLFIGLWSCCDDAGRTRAASRYLASTLFPYDEDAPERVGDWLDELEREELIVRYKVGRDSYLEIRHWTSYQRIDRPSPSKLPSPQEGSRILASPREDSLQTEATVDRHVNRDGDNPPDRRPSNREPPERGEDGNFKPDPAQDKGDGTRWIMDLWNERAPKGLPRCAIWSQKRQRHARERLKEFPDRADWERAIGSIAESAFLMGQNDRKWKANIDWLLERPNSVARLLEGAYVGGRVHRPLIAGNYDDYEFKEFQSPPAEPSQPVFPDEPQTVPAESQTVPGGPDDDDLQF